MASKAELVALLRHLRSWIEDTSSMRAADFRARIDAALAEPEAGKTVRVRACVGWNTCDDAFARRQALKNLPHELGDSFTCFGEIDVPLPQAVEVEEVVQP